ncbi:unnamed protein product [Caenorhabditis sp. 36 PRJEB53466]|nr:unnamed protein product [Caenorhabditis sp. 36 PRJEB53466]
MKRKQRTLSIRTTANLTSSMRSERQEETFEVTSPSPSIISLSSEKMSAESAKPPLEKKSEKRTVHIRKEKVIAYDLELASLCERTCDTASMVSIPDLEDVEEFEKKCEAPTTAAVQLIPIKYVRKRTSIPIRAKLVRDFDPGDATSALKSDKEKKEKSKIEVQNTKGAHQSEGSVKERKPESSDKEIVEYNLQTHMFSNFYHAVKKRFWP